MNFTNSVSNQSVLKQQATLLIELWIESSGREFLTMMLRETQGTDFLLACLVKEGRELSAGELARKLNVSTARMAKLLNTLEQKGFIKRQNSEKDGRKTLVSLTCEGMERFKEKRLYLMTLLEKMIEQIGFEELCEFIRISNKIGDAFIACSEQRGK